MSIHVTLELQAKPETIDDLTATLKAILPDTRAYKGCQNIIVTANQDNPLKLILIEKWDSRADQESYFAWRGERGDLAKLGELLASPPTTTYLDTVEA